MRDFETRRPEPNTQLSLTASRQERALETARIKRRRHVALEEEARLQGPFQALSRLAVKLGAWAAMLAVDRNA